MAANNKRSLKAIRQRLQDIAAPWSEAYNPLELELDALLGAVDAFEAEIASAVEHLEEEVDW